MCLELFNLDPLMTKELLEKFPKTMRYVSICQACDTTQPEPYRFHPAENLTTLSLERCVIDLSQASFPNLRQLFIDRVFVAPENNAVALVDVMSSMLNLEYLGMYHCRTTSLGPLVVKLLQQSTLRSVILVDCNLSVGDGELIMKLIQDGKLDHIWSLRLFGHDELREQEQRFMELCREHFIEHQISTEIWFDISTLLKSASQRESQEWKEDSQQGDHDGASLAKLLTGIIQKQVEEFEIPRNWSVLNRWLKNLPESGTIADNNPENMQTVISGSSNVTLEQVQTMMTMFQTMMTTFSNTALELKQIAMTNVLNMTTEQMQTAITRYSKMTTEQMETLMTSYSKMTREQMQTAMTSYSKITPEQMQTLMTSYSKMTPEQLQTAITLISDMTPEQILTAITRYSKMTTEQMETLMTGYSKMTREQLQTAITSYSKMTPEQIQTSMTNYSKMSPEQMQTEMTKISNMTPEQLQTAMTLISDMTPEQMLTVMTSYSNMTPEQLEAMETLSSNITPEQMQTAMTIYSNMTTEQKTTGMSIFFKMTPEQMQTGLTSYSKMSPEQMQAAITSFSNMTPEQMQAGMTGLSNTTPGQTQIMTPFLPTTDQDQSSSRAQKETARIEALEQEHASGATDTDSSVTQEQEGNDMAQTMTSWCCCSKFYRIF